MRAFASASGGVIFIPDEIEQETKTQAKISYADFEGVMPDTEKRDIISLFFGKRKPPAAPKKIREAA